MCVFSRKDRVLSYMKSIQLFEFNFDNHLMSGEFWFLQWKCIPSDLKMILLIY